MENKLNIAELLKDCPKGMELDCATYDNVSFDKISDDKKATYPIFCYITDKEGNRSGISFTENGCESKRYGAKCVIFPKGKTTWEGFQRPFKDGDILTYISNYTTTFIYRNKDNEPNFSTSFYVACNNEPSHNFLIYNKHTLIALNENCDVRLATEEEKQKLFDAIKANGYKWNAETKTLEKLIEPKFKVGDKIVKRNSVSNSWIVSSVNSENYKLKLPLGGESIAVLSFSEQDGYELLRNTNKFDITTLKPFDRVLTKVTHDGVWGNDFFGYYKDGWFYCSGHIALHYCIPYENNEHLLGTTNDCDDYYKTWE